MDLYTNTLESAGDGLSIGDLARRSGIGVSTLRAWEQRHGFPVPQRLPSGHRRYSEQDANAVSEVERERRSGSTLEAALLRAKERVGLQRSSLFATLSTALPHVAPASLSKRTMVAISHAIEDEASARAQQPIFVGAFQDARFWRAAADRWRGLVGASDATVVMASFRKSRRHGPLFEVSVQSGTPVLREWAVICDSPTFSACLVGIERLGSRAPIDSARRFEALWTVEPLAVREAARTGVALAADCYSSVAEALGSRLQQPVRATYDSIRVATAITNRVVAYMERDS